MADNRDTVKTSVQTLNVPTVTNAIMNSMFDEVIDNCMFVADKATAVTHTVTGESSLDFTSVDRIDLTCLGVDTGITVSGMSDGAIKYVLITKTSGNTVLFSGITDITPTISEVNSATTVLYAIIRKGSNYYARAWVNIADGDTSTRGLMRTASTSETDAGTDTDIAVSPAGLQNRQMTQSLSGIAQWATQAQVDSSTDTVSGESLCIRPSTLKTTNDRISVLEDRYVATTASQSVTGSGTQNFVITHNLGTTNYSISISLISTQVMYYVVTNKATNTCTVTVANPSSTANAALDVIIIKQ